MSDMKADMTELHSKTHFVLVHGFSSGGWCWYKIKTLMDEAGYKVSCPDLKSAGIDNTDVASIDTIEEYDEPLIHLLSSASEREKIVLVGTSAGGVSLTHMMHKFPQKIHMTIFVGATMLRNGLVSEQDIKDGLPDLSEFNLGYGLGDDQPPTNAIMKIESSLALALPLCSPQDKVLSTLLQKPGPIHIMQRAKFIGEEGIDEMKRVYIKTTKDLTLTPRQQDAMIKKWPPTAVLDLESDHNPFLSTPFELFSMILKAAAI